MSTIYSNKLENVTFHEKKIKKR